MDDHDQAAGMPKTANSQNLLSGPKPLVLLDFGAEGIRAGIVQRDSLLRCQLGREALSPESLVTVYQQGSFSTAEGEAPAFPTLLDQLGSDQQISLPGAPPDLPHNLLANLLARATAGLRAWWGKSLEELAVLVPTYLNDLQRSVIVKHCQAVDWHKVYLINKTTALGAHALADRPAGHYLLAVLGHGPADISVVHWQPAHMRLADHTSRPELSGGWLDRFLIKVALGQLAQQAGAAIESPLYSEADWLWLRERMETVRRRLCVYQNVALQIPAGLTDGVARTVSFDRNRWMPVLDEFADLFRSTMETCCQGANIEPEKLQGCMLSGRLLLQHALLAKIQQKCGPVPVVAYPHEAQLLGACRMLAGAAQAPGSSPADASGDRLPSPPLPDFKQVCIRATVQQVPPAAGDASPYGADNIIAEVRRLYSSGQVEAARTKLKPLAQYIDALQLSLVPPDQALSRLSHDGQQNTPPLAGEAPVKKPPGDATEQKSDEQPSKRAQRRRYLLAREDIKKAQAALNNGQLEQAVGLSHVALERSDDHRIFEAMIKVHLRAASKRPLQIQYFDDDRRWLVCALSDDGTNEEVQEALVRRYMRHVEQLVALSTKEGHTRAVDALTELAQYVPLPETAAAWLQELRHSGPGEVRLTPAPEAPSS